MAKKAYLWKARGQICCGGCFDCYEPAKYYKEDDTYPSYCKRCVKKRGYKPVDKIHPKCSEK